MSMNETIFAAAQSGDVTQVSALLDQDPALVNARDTDGTSVLISALYRNRMPIVETLRAHGVVLDIFEAAALGDTTRLDELLTIDPALIQAYSSDGWTALHLAAFFNQSPAVQLLLQHGADVQARSTNDMNNQPLHAAVANNAHLDVIAHLLDAGADVNAQQRGGFTPLHEAAQNGNLALVEFLLARGANPTNATDAGKTPLILASEEGRTGVVDLLRAESAG